MPPPNGGRAAALALGLLSSLPGSALELHLDAGAWRVPAFHLPTPAPLHGLESWQLNGAVQSNQSSNSLALISIAGAAPLAVRPGELIVEGITLLAVYRDHVRVQRGDRQALLYLDNATSQRALQQQLKAMQQAVEAATEAHRVARNRYEGGLARYLDVLSAEDQLLASVRQLVDVQSRALTLDIGLHRALGGGWSEDASAQKTAEQP